MINIYKLHNQIKHYEWGSKLAIPQFLGIENNKGIPFAEMWMGTHSGAPSQVLADGVYKNLNEIAGDLPFLFKLLAVENPLSIQVHPDKQQAEEGFLREENAGLDIQSPVRNYKDPNNKSEIICAITAFTLMAGFRQPEEMVSSLGEFSPDQEILMKNLEALYPGDPAIYSPLYLNLITLQPGQAVYIPSGIPHAYINGFGVELMNSSDNVLRGGLTSKHTDIDELMKILKVDPYLPQVITPDSRTWFSYTTPENNFSLSLIRSDGSKIPYKENGPAVCIITEGELKIDGNIYKKGDSFFVPQSIDPLIFEGNFSLYSASSQKPDSISAAGLK